MCVLCSSVNLYLWRSLAAVSVTAGLATCARSLVWRKKEKTAKIEVMVKLRPLGVFKL